MDRRKVLAAIADAALEWLAGMQREGKVHLQHEIGVDDVVEETNEDS